MKKTRTWVLIADGAYARILENLGPSRGFRPVVERRLQSAADRARGRDRRGRSHESASPARHAIEPRTDWHRFEKAQFARSVAKLLDEAAGRGDYDRLVLVAPPRTLGDLRRALGSHARERITGEVDKDLTQVTVNELPDHLYRLMPL